MSNSMPYETPLEKRLTLNDIALVRKNSPIIQTEEFNITNINQFIEYVYSHDMFFKDNGDTKQLYSITEVNQGIIKLTKINCLFDVNKELANFLLSDGEKRMDNFEFTNNPFFYAQLGRDNGQFGTYVMMKDGSRAFILKDGQIKKEPK